MYIINTASLKAMPLNKFTKRVKYVMDREHSIDLDTMMDWMMAEYITRTQIFGNDGIYSVCRTVP